MTRLHSSLSERLPPIVQALALQMFAALGAFLALKVFGPAPSIWIVFLSAGVLAALLTKLAGLEFWWVIIQFLFPPLVLSLLWFDVPSWIYLALFSGLGLVYWSTFRTRVPLYLSNAETWRAVEALLPPPRTGKPCRFADLGSGLGGLLFALSARRPDIEFTGIELAPVPALLSWVRKWLTGCRNLQIHWGSFWSRDLAEFEVVFAFLSPVPMGELFAKVQREMRPGTLFVSCAFEVPGAAPDQVIDLPSPRQSRLLVWRITARL